MPLVLCSAAIFARCTSNAAFMSSGFLDKLVLIVKAKGERRRGEQRLTVNSRRFFLVLVLMIRLVLGDPWSQPGASFLCVSPRPVAQGVWLSGPPVTRFVENLVK